MSNVHVRPMNASPHHGDGQRFSVVHRHSMSSRGMLRHWHNEIELFFVQSGPITLHVEDSSFTLKAGEAVLIPPKLCHWASKDVNSHAAYSIVSFCVSLFYGRGYRRFVGPMMLNGKAFVHKMCGKKDSPHECRGILSQLLFFHDLSDGDARELEFCGLVFILISKVYNCFFSNLPATIAYQKQYSRLHNAIDYIHNHYGEEINVPLLAKLSHLAVGTFCRYFKQLLGESPVSYMNNYRIRRSSVLLIESSLKISEIAFSCGYNNLSHFNRDFKNRMGCTPTQYRSY